MEKYIKLSDVKDILSKLIHEPRYQHEDEDFYSGVCAVDCELSELQTIDLEEPKLVATWKLSYKGLLGSDYICSNCGCPAQEGNTGHYDRLTDFCRDCGAKMIGESNVPDHRHEE